jgi:hypothetical protein
MLSSGTKFYHLGQNVIISDEMLSSGIQCFHLELTLPSGTKCYHLGLNVIIWSKCYHLGRNVIIWDEMLSAGANVTIWDKMLSCGANVVMLLFGAIDIMVLSCDVIIWDDNTSLFYFS